MSSGSKPATNLNTDVPPAGNGLATSASASDSNSSVVATDATQADSPAGPLASNEGLAANVDGTPTKCAPPVFIRWSPNSGLPVPTETLPVPPPPGLPLPTDIRGSSDVLEVNWILDEIFLELNSDSSTRLVLEQLRNDQSIRLPYGWDRVHERWILLESFKDGLPTWDSHVFWGKYTPGLGECVVVHEGRQLLFFQQYRFYREINDLYLKSIERPLPKEMVIPGMHSLPLGHWMPLGSPTEMGRPGQGCRIPKADEQLPLDGVPHFEPVTRSPVFGVTLEELDALREDLFNSKLIDSKPTPFSSILSKDHPGKEYVMPSYCRLTMQLAVPEGLEPASGEPVVVSESNSSVLCCLERMFGEDSAGEQTDPPTSVSSESVSSTQDQSRLSTIEELVESLNSKKSRTAASPSASDISLVAFGASASSSTQDVGVPGKSGVLSKSSVKVNGSDNNAARTPDAPTTLLGGTQGQMGERPVVSDGSEGGTDAVRTLDAPTPTGETQQQKDERLMNERRMSELLANDISLVTTIEKLGDIWKKHAEDMTIARNSGSKTVPQKWSEVFKDIFFYVVEEKEKVNCSWSAEVAQKFAKKRIMTLRSSNEHRLFFFWEFLLELTPLPEAIIQDVFYLENLFSGPYKEIYSKKESSYFDSVTGIKRVDSFFLNTYGTISKNVLDAEERMEVHQKKLQDYIKRQTTVRELVPQFGVDAIKLTNWMEKMFAVKWVHFSATWNEMKPKVREQFQAKFFKARYEELHAYDPDLKVEKSCVYAEKLFSQPSFVIGFDAFAMDQVLKKCDDLKKRLGFFDFYTKNIFAQDLNKDVDVIVEEGPADGLKAEGIPDIDFNFA